MSILTNRIKRLYPKCDMQFVIAPKKMYKDLLKLQKKYKERTGKTWKQLETNNKKNGR